MPAIDPIVTVTGHVRRSVRDRFAAYARSVGHKPAALIRMFAEEAAGEAPTVPVGGSSQKITLRLRDDVRRRLHEQAAATRTTPTACASAILEAQLCGRLRWTEPQVVELRAARVLLADLRDKAVDATAADQVAKAMRLVDAAIAGQASYWGATAPAASPAGPRPASPAAGPGYAGPSHAEASPLP